MQRYSMFSQFAAFWQLNDTLKRFLVVWAFVSFGYFGIMGVLLNLYLIRLDFEIEFIGLLIASGQVIWAILALPAGNIGKRMGLRNAIAMGHVLTGTGLGLLLLVELVPRAWWIQWVFTSWAIIWIGAALNTVNATPYTMHASSLQERNVAFSAQSAVIAFFGFAGGIVAGWLPQLFASMTGVAVDGAAAYRQALWVVPALFYIGAILMMRNTPLRIHAEPSTGGRAVLPIGLFIFLGAVVILQTASEGIARAFLNLYLDVDLNVATARIGVIIGVGQLLPVWASLQTPQLLDRWGPGRTLAYTSLGLCFSLLVLAFFRHWLGATLGFTAIMALTAVAGAARNLFSQEIVPASLRTTTSAILTIGLGLGWASAAGIGGYVIEATGFRSLFSLSSILPLASAMLLFVYLQRTPTRSPS